MSIHRNCEGIHRRDCLRLGASGVLGMGLVDLLRMKAQASPTSLNSLDQNSAPTSCILVWLDGGPTHYETFDPKPNAPVEIRGEYNPIKTTVPGIHFSQHMRRLGAIADKLAIVRSIRHNQGNHGAGNHYMMTGAPPRIPVGCGAFVSFHPSLGSVAAHERGAPHGLPAYFSIPNMSRSGGPNFLGAKYAPFVVPDDPNRKNFRVRDVTVPGELLADRVLRRTELRESVDQLQRFVDRQVADPAVPFDEYYEQAYSLVTSDEAKKAFELSSEPDVLRDTYGRNSFGQRALLARRLVEAGVPFVTLYNGGWDHHTNLFKSLDRKLPPVDAAVAALINDLDDRGLLETTLVVMLGEFGRTPKINKDGGRDHWSNAMSVMFAGCGINGGQIVGSTDRSGYAANERVLAPENFVSTVYAKLGIDPGKIYHTPQGRPVHLVSDPTPISELMGA